MSHPTGLTQRIQALARSSAPTKKPLRPSKAKLQRIINDHPDSLQAKLATSPYAAILASPMRHCTFNRKTYPSRLLQRFEIGLHPETHVAWGYPSDDGDGRGYYVKLNQSVLAHVQTKDHKRLFRGAARYPKDMNQHLHQRMIQSLVAQVASVNYTQIQQNGAYQCVLLLKPPSTTTASASSSSPLSMDVIEYPVYAPFWRPLYDAILTHLGDNDQVVPEKLGIVKSMDSVAFAVDLFRFHQWLQSSPSS